ncbi:aquaporin-like protein [Chytridium lagenaria]|nr:aquaporin-like protein [Chytridium lagenaria]
MSYFAKHTPAENNTNGASSTSVAVPVDQPHSAPLLPSTAADRAALTKELVQAAAEFIGTFFFLFISYGTIQTAAGHVDKLTTISLAFGLALTTGVWLTYRISGGALNPAVVFGLLILGKITPRKAALYVAGELLGATFAAFIVALIFPGAWSNFGGANTVFHPSSSIQAVLLETILTSGLVLVVLFIAVEKSKATFIAPLLIGLYVFLAHLPSITLDNTSLNPARSFGAAVLSGYWSFHWVFWVGPFLGASLAAGIYTFFKHFNYETLNPEQEDDHAAARIRLH